MFARIEHTLIQAQQYVSVFVCEIFVVIYLLMTQGIMADKFLLPSM